MSLPGVAQISFSISLYHSRDNQNSGGLLPNWCFLIVRWRSSVPETLEFTVHDEPMCLNNSPLLTVNVAWNQVKCEPILVSTHSCKTHYRDDKYVLFYSYRNILYSDLCALWVSAWRSSYQAFGVLLRSKTKQHQSIARVTLTVVYWQWMLCDKLFCEWLSLVNTK